MDDKQNKSRQDDERIDQESSDFSNSQTDDLSRGQKGGRVGYSEEVIVTENLDNPEDQLDSDDQA